MNTNPIRIFLFALLFASLAGCRTESYSGKQNVEFEGAICFSVPDGFVVAGDLHDNAQLQLKDPVNDIFFIGLSDKKREIKRIFPHFGLNDYLTFVSRKITTEMSDFRVASQNEFSVGRMKGKTIEIHGARNRSTKDMDLVFSVTVLENSTHYFQVVSWSHENQSSLLCSASSEFVGTAGEITASGSEASGPEAQMH